jgi:8-amino-7-oxononanoate synthase
LVSGTHSVHTDLEVALATYLGMPSTLLFQSGYQANLGVLSALAGPDDLIVADRDVHASILDGCRLSRAKLAIYPHLDATTAAKHLSRLGPGRRRRFLVTESLFSMDGDVAPLATLASIASDHDTALIVDEAHAIGYLGPSGRGLCAEYQVRPDILIGTFGKAFGSSGAFVAGTEDLRTYLVNHSRSFIFTTALPIPIVAASMAALHIIASSEGDQLRERLSLRVRQLRTALELPQGTIPSPILPIILGTDDLAFAASNQLRALGFFIQAIRPPTVREGTSRLRITLSSRHTELQVADLAAAIQATNTGPIHSSSHKPRSCPQDDPPPFRSSNKRSSVMPGPGIFLLGTDTGVGKTSVAVALLQLLAIRGCRPVPFKPVETGAYPLPADAARLLAASMRQDISLGIVCPLPFREPIAPAAASAGHPLSLDQLLGHARNAASYGSPMVVESAGGLLTPYAPHLTSLDLAVALGFPVLLVARNGLGTINHTALAVAEIRRRQVPFLGTILVTTTTASTPDQDSNLSLIYTATGERPLGILPHCTSPTPPILAEALSASVDLGQILSQLSI